MIRHKLTNFGAKHVLAQMADGSTRTVAPGRVTIGSIVTVFVSDELAHFAVRTIRPKPRKKKVKKHG